MAHSEAQNKKRQSISMKIHCKPHNMGGQTQLVDTILQILTGVRPYPPVASTVFLARIRLIEPCCNCSFEIPEWNRVGHFYFMVYHVYRPNNKSCGIRQIYQQLVESVCLVTTWLAKMKSEKKYSWLMFTATPNVLQKNK